MLQGCGGHTIPVVGVTDVAGPEAVRAPLSGAVGLHGFLLPADLLLEEEGS